MNIVELLKPSAKTALIQGDMRVSYSELLDAGKHFGGCLRKEGIGMGKYVLVFVPLSVELYQVMIGAWNVGAIPIFIDFSRGVKFVNASIARLKPDIIVCDHVTGFIRILYPQIRKIKMIKVHRSDEPVCIENLNPEHPAILTFTSGTTGIPKVAVRSHGFLVDQYNVLAQHLDFSENHIDLGTLPVFTLASLAANMTTVLPYKSYTSTIDPAKLALKMEREKITRVICSPALMANLLQHSHFPDLKCACLGGAPVYPSLLGKMDKNVDLHIVYGSTEAEPISSVRWADIDSKDRDKIANGAGLLVGSIVPEVECEIGDDNEILVSGKTVLKSYLDGIGDKENKIRDGAKIWHKTGDAGYFDERGRLWLLGRVSQAIHDAEGILYPFCVECILDAHFGIRGAIIARDGERCVVIEKGTQHPDDVLQLLKPQHIARVITLKKIPMDKRHGAKIDYARLMKML